MKLQRISRLVAEVGLGQPLPGRKEMSPGSTQEFFKGKELSFLGAITENVSHVLRYRAK